MSPDTGKWPHGYGCEMLARMLMARATRDGIKVVIKFTYPKPAKKPRARRAKP